MTQNAPSPEQIKALRQYAVENGRTWKSALRQAWMTGNYEGFSESNYLQQIRNQFGPSWLVKFRFPNPERQIDQQYFDYEQAGKYIGKTAEAIRKYVSYGWIHATKRGHKLRWISKAELDRFMSTSD